MPSPTFVEIKIENRVGWVVLNRPPLNVMNTQMLNELRGAVEDLDRDERVAVIALRSSGEKAFSAGADVGDHTPEVEAEHFDAMYDLITKLQVNDAKPRVAVVHGFCFGGGIELAFSCDWVIARSDAKFAMPEVGLGIVNALGATALLRFISHANAMELALSGRRIGADEAYRMGMIAHLLGEDEFETKAVELVERTAQRSRVALQNGRRAIHECLDQKRSDRLETLRSDIDARSTEDYREGMQAYLEKRQPVWRDR
jgi:enoyl-CoA hydratase/carnithine racemase